MNKRIYLSSPHMGGSELTYVKEAFETNWISPVGPNIQAFEEQLTNYSGISHAAALSSGTAAIHLALILLNVTSGDEVFCSTFTFSGSCNPIKYLGATPVFIDSEEDTWNMDPDVLEMALKERTAKGKTPKAIILVHLYGMPAKMDELLKIAAEYEVPVIEDAAEAVGAEYHGKKAGSFGRMGIYSFNGNKIITTSGGGALLAEEEELICKARFLATQARDEAPHYEHSHVGYNYRMSNVVAGIGRGQMEILEEHVEIRRELFDWYKSFFKNYEGFALVDEPEGVRANRWLTTIVMDKSKTGMDREQFRRGLEEVDIESRPLWKPMHLQPVYRDAPAYITGVSDRLFENGLCLPSGSNMTQGDKERIIERIKELVEVTQGG